MNEMCPLTIGLACIGLWCKQIFHEIIYYECTEYGKNLPGVFLF